MSSSPGDISERLLAAEEAMMMGQYSTAEALLEEILRAEPENEKALYDLAVLYEITHQPQRARALYSKLVELKPEDPTYRDKLEELSGL